MRRRRVLPVTDVEKLEELAKADAWTRLIGANEGVGRHQDLSAEYSRMRREALTELIAEGRSRRELADKLGVTRARVGQLLTTGPHPARALLGLSALTIAVGGKPEGPRVNPSTVISAEATIARELIADTARGYGLEVVSEVVDPPGMVDLNRPNLIVIGSPRLLPFVSQVLAADSNLGFGSGKQGWYLTAGDKIYRSPSDSGEPRDYAYIGRLPRPDSKGTFLYLAGIHAMGTLGAATYLCSHLEEIYEVVKNRRWSVLMECRYDPDSRVIESTEPITPIYSQ